MFLKEKLRDYIYNHKKLKYWMMVITRSRDSKWVNNVVHVWNSIDSVVAEYRGDNNRDVILYDIQCNGPTGFMGTVMNVLYNLWYADRFNMKPVVTAHNELYEEEEPVNGASQFWEYYFKPCSSYSTDDLRDSFTVVPYRGKDYSELGRLWGQSESKTYRISEESIKDLGRIYGKYVFLNDAMKQKLKEDINKLLGGKRTLGVHVRRGDMLANVDHHPIPAEISDFIEATNIALESNYFAQIFVATSDKEVIEVFRKEYGSKMVAYSDVVRTEGIQGVWEVKDTRKNRKYMSGVDVLRDAYTLVNCDGFIACLSNVSAMAQIIKAGRNEKYDYLYTVDKGINHNSKKAEVLINKQIKNVKRMEK